jgi:CubicO group peptidase (beta-lactamase class C family)
MKYLCAFLFLVISNLCMAQKTLPANVVESIRQRIEYGMNPGIAVGIIDADGVHYFNFGRTSADGKAITEHSIFEIGSITKTFTAIMLADMAIKGQLSIDDPVIKFLPESVTFPSYGETQITLGHLSDHTSSLPRMPDNMIPADPLNPYADYTVEQMYTFLSSHTLTRGVGSEYEYSNLAQGLLGHILALQAGMSYEELLKSTITSPLQMHETGITFTDHMTKNLAKPHSQGLVVSNWDLPTLAGAGAIRSSTHDMLKYLAANLGLTDTPVSEAMAMTHYPRHDKGGRVGLGWHIAEGSQGDVIWHNGGTGGYRAFAGFLKETGRGVVLLTNSDVDVDDIGFHLLDPISKLKTVKPHVARELRKHIDNKGPAKLEEKFALLKKEGTEKYDFSEMDINALGYYYLGLKNLDAALALFKINTIEYPESSNVWDSYGEALMEKGETEAAIENYKKSLELNPGNNNAIEMLAKMGVEISVPQVYVSENILQTYEGTYELTPNFKIVITREGPQLYGQATSQPRFDLYAKTETEFYLKVVDARIEFNINADGSVKSLTLFQGGQVIEGTRL